MGIYSKKIKSLTDLLLKALKLPFLMILQTAAVLLLYFEKAGIIKLKDGAGVTATIKDIVTNTKNIQISELEAPQLPRVLDDVTIAVINTNYALGSQISTN